MEQQKIAGVDNTVATGKQLAITYYTDPLCCWSWAFEKVWQQLLQQLGDRANVRYCMGGLLESWKSYHDAEHAVSKPAQMGPLWMQASHLTATPIDSAIWVLDPPSSSYLACTAVKSAFLQSFDYGQAYLLRLRQAVMTERINIAGQKALLNIAGEMATEVSGFDVQQFEDDLVNGKGYKAFTADLQEVRYRGIQRFPALAIETNKGRGMLITGYKPLHSIVNAINNL